MRKMAILDQPRIVGLTLLELWQRTKRRMRTGSFGIGKLSGPAPERLLLAPQDLRTADPTLALEFYAGIFSFAGKTIETRGNNPFIVPAPSIEWEKTLHSFRWFRHLDIADTALSQSNAQAFISDWISTNAKGKNPVAWDLEVTSKRLIAWLCHSLIVVENSNHAFYRKFMKSIGQHVRYLRRMAIDAPEGLPRLRCHIALAYTAICVSDQKVALRNAQKHLSDELRAQILPDGGHISRNPSVLPQILADLLPLRQAYAWQGDLPPEELISTIERIIPAIRFFRLGDGNLAHFNATATTQQDLMATLLRYDDTRGKPPTNASHSGFQRFENEGTVLIVDTGKPAQGALSKTAHAGCLSFEMSSGTRNLIINCGAPSLTHSTLEASSNQFFHHQVWRSTAAHSTATLHNTSSCKFQFTGGSNHMLEGRVISGPSKVTVKRETEGGTDKIIASHDAYVRDFGINHRRMLELTQDGKTLMGCDEFYANDGSKAKYATKGDVAIRFHLHPTVELASGTNNQNILLKLDDGETWKFSCIDVPITVEESIFFAVPEGAAKTNQIALHLNAAEISEVRWILERQA